MNVYLIEDDGQVTVFDAGIEAMGPALRAACARFGGIKRVVLGPCRLPTTAGPRRRSALRSTATRPTATPLQSERPFRDYWDLEKLAPYARPAYAKLVPAWDGGATQVAGTVAEGDEVAGFRVIDLPGHAPGLIGLFRESDRLALVSDCFYTIDPQSGRKVPVRVPHRAFNADAEQTRASMRKLADLEPATAWGGHGDPVTGDVATQLRRAASPVSRRSRQRPKLTAPTTEYTGP